MANRPLAYGERRHRGIWRHRHAHTLVPKQNRGERKNGVQANTSHHKARRATLALEEILHTYQRKLRASGSTCKET